MIDLASEALGVEVHPSQPVERLRDAGRRPRRRAGSRTGVPGKIIEELFEATVEDGLTGPIFVTGHPVEISPLARVDRNDPYLTERFELYVGGRELANGYSELNDPVEQRQRFEDEQRAKEAGDLGRRHASTRTTCGPSSTACRRRAASGIGIDRVAMLLAGVTTIKEVILFPTLRPEALLDGQLSGRGGRRRTRRAARR